MSTDVVLPQLDRILDSPQFRTSKRCSLFLRYVVEHASENHVECLKERVLGVEVFKRDPNYDTNQDPVVRGTAGEVRKRLAQYYLEPGHEEEFRISLPAGSYVPEIHAPPERVEAVKPAPRTSNRIWLLAAAAGVVLVASAAFLSPGFRRTGLDRFWAPVIEPQDTVLVCVGQPRVYSFNKKVRNEMTRWFENGQDKDNAPPSSGTVPVSEIVPLWDRFVSLDDAQAFLQLSTMFGQKGKKVQLRGGRSVSLADLRGKPCVLIGAFNNDWTLSLAGELRFYFDVDERNGMLVVRDRQAPNESEWKVSSEWTQLKIPADYAIVSRVLNPTTEQTVVIVAGITHYGTHVAGEFITNEAYFAEALNNAPRDWYRKNMQVVLSTKVMSGTHGPPNVLAVHFW